MFSLLTLGGASFLFAFLLTPLIRNLFRRMGMVDTPDHRRKFHDIGIPRVGGIPLALAYVTAFAVVLLFELKGGIIVRQGLPFAVRLLPAVAVVFLTGLLDDLIGLRPWQKLIGQLCAGGLAIWAGVFIHRFDGIVFNPVWGLPVTLLWLIGCTNAFNLIDGVDGLAAGIGLFATVTTLVAALIQGNVELAFATAPLAGALLGFLRFNFNPASIFLGDSGSLLIGFLLGCFGVIWSQKSATLLGMTAPLMALSIPLLDTAIAIMRRYLRRKPIFEADNGHIHHQLLARGWTPRRVALLLYGVCGLAAAFSLLQSVVNQRYSGLVVVIFCAAAWMGVQHLGYVEFGMAGRLVLRGGFRRILGAQLILRALEQDLAKARTAEECWNTVWQAAQGLEFTAARASLAGVVYSNQCAESGHAPTWSIRIPLTESDYLNLTRPIDSLADSSAWASLIEIVHKALLLKLPSFEKRFSAPA
jgi:UDP-GlcNAc:undecaprenyl-phosphate/decaprenyl-phosphate GlcNAc-1-phosphate transferase